MANKEPVKVYLDLGSPSSIVSNISYDTEKLFKAYTKGRGTSRTLFISVEEIKRVSPMLAKFFEGESDV